MYIPEQYGIQTAGFWSWLTDRDEVLCSPTCLTIIGLDPDRFNVSLSEVEERIHPEDLQHFRSCLQRHLEQQFEFNVELRIRGSSGRYRQTTSRGEAVRNRSGAIVQMSGSIFIEDRRLFGEGVSQQAPEIWEQKEESSRELKRRLQKAQELGKSGFFEIDIEAGRAYWDRGTCRLYGLNDDERWMDLAEMLERIYPDDVEEVKSKLSRLQTVGDSAESEHRIVGFDGKIRWVSARGEVIESEAVGKRLVGTLIDISESRLTLQALRAAQKDLEAQHELLEIAGKTSRFGGWKVDLKSGLSTWTEAITEIHELPKKSQVSVKKGIDYYVPEHREIIAEAFKDCAERGIPYDLELQIINHKGRRIWVRTCGWAMKDKKGKITTVHGSFQDIDERKKDEERLRHLAEYQKMIAKLEERLGRSNLEEINPAIQESLAMLCNFTSSDRAYLFQFEECFTKIRNTHEYCMEGIEPEIERLKHNVPFEKELSWLKEQITEGRTISIPDISALPDEAVLTRKYLDSISVLSFIAQPIFLNGDLFGLIGFDAVREPREWCDEDKELLKHFGQIINNTLEWRHSQEALKTSEAHFRDLFANANEGVCVVSRDGRFIRVNQAMCAILGYSKNELETMTVAEVTYPQDRELSAAAMKGVLAGKTKSKAFEKRYIRKDGVVRWGRVSTSLLRDARGEPLHFISQISDITERIEMDRAKEEVQRIMRHDLKNPLTVIIGFPQLLTESPRLNDEDKSMIRMIKDAGEKMLHMIDLSLDLFKIETGNYVFAPEDINIVKLLHNLVEENKAKRLTRQLRLEFTLDGNSPDRTAKVLVPALSHLLYSMVSNLLANAMEASPVGGLVEIELRRNKDVTLTIRNSGAVPNKIRENFFQKYVTSEKSNGTGLGTYSAKLIAGAMGYDLRMQTSDATDTTELTVTIPTRGGG